MSGTGRTRSELAAAGNSDGDVSSPAIPNLTAEVIETMIASALATQEATWSANGRLLPVGRNINIENVAPTSVAETSPKSVTFQFVIDPYKSDFNPGDRHGASIYNTATETLKESDQFTFSQDKAANLLQHLKRQSQTYFWGKTANMVQVFPEDTSENPDPDNKQSLLIQPNLIPLSSVRMEAAACWGTAVGT